MTASQNATFTDLPVEMRCQIYGYLLEEPQAIAITLTKSGVLIRRGGTLPSSSQKSNRGRHFNRTTEQWTPAIPIKTAIMYANRQIYEEASTILYGNNWFSFRLISSITKLAPVLGKQVQLFRKIEIEDMGYSQGSAEAAFDSLALAKGLKTIVISHNDVCKAGGWSRQPIASLAGVVKSSKKLLQALHDSHLEHNLSTSILDLFQLRTGTEGSKCSSSEPEHARFCGCVCSQGERLNTELQTELHALISAEFSMEYPAGRK